MIQPRAAKGLPALRNRLIGGAVDVVTGAFVLQDLDLVVPGEIPITWSRTYNSARHTERRGVGRGFRHELDRELLLDTEELTIVDQAGFETVFPPIEQDGQKIARGGFIVERVNKSRFRLTLSDYPTAEMTIQSSGLSAVITGFIESDGWLRVTRDRDGRLRAIRSAEGATVEICWRQDLIEELRLATEFGSEPESVVRYGYSSDNRLAVVESKGQQLRRYKYDELGRVFQRIEANGATTRVEYDHDGRCSRLMAPDGASSFQFEYYPDAFQTVVTRPDGHRWIFTTDELGTITHVMVPGCSVTEILLDDDGLPIGERDGAGEEWTYELDRTGLPKATVSGGRRLSMGENVESQNSTEVRQPETVLECFYGDLFPYPDRLPDVYGLSPVLPSRVLKSIHTSEGIKKVIKESEFDDFGRLIELQAPGTGRQRCGRDQSGAVLWYEDADGGRYELKRSHDGQLSSHTDPLGATTRFEYSGTGALTAVIDPVGNRTEFERDGVDRIVGLRRNGRLKESLRLEMGGDLCEKRDGRDQSILSITRGPGHAIETIELPSGGAIEFETDDIGRVISTTSMGHRIERQYTSTTGKLVLDSIDGEGVERRYEAGVLEEIQVLDQFFTRYEQNDEASLTIIDPSDKQHELRQLAPGQIQCRMSNGLEIFHQFDLAGRLILSAQWFSSNPEGVTLRSYSYSDGGMLLSCDDSIYGETSYSHDASHRLEKIYRPNGSIDVFSHDASGTVTVRPGLELTVNGGRVVGAGGHPVEYDERGNIRLRTAGERMVWYYYDSLDRLTGVKFSDGERYEYEYDGLSRRILTKGPQGPHRFIWDGHRLAAEVLPSGAFRVYVYADELSLVPLLFIDYESVEDEFFFGKAGFPLTNHMACPEVVQDAEGKVLWAAAVDPLGLATVSEGADFHQPLRFPGQYFDSTVGLSFSRFRVYAPDLGCYLQSNPVGIAGGINLNSRCHDPLSQLDVSGLGATTLCGFPSRSRSQELMPLVEHDTLRLPERILQAQELLVKTEQDLERSREASFAAIQTCRQVMSRSAKLRLEFENKVNDLEKRFADLCRRCEESSRTSLAIGRFQEIEQKATRMMEKMLGAGEFDEDKRTRIAMTRAWKRFTVRGGL